jgi:hypothetical protein
MKDMVLSTENVIKNHEKVISIYAPFDQVKSHLKTKPKAKLKKGPVLFVCF